MNDPQRDIRVWLHDELSQRGRGVKVALAKRLGIRPDAITRMMNMDPNKETREIRAHEADAMRRFFADEALADDPDRDSVPLVGYVGAGAAAHFYADTQGELERVPAPEGATQDTVAMEIRGESLGALFEHWLVYYDEIRSPVTTDMIGRLCVVGLIDDRVLVKKLQRAKSPGLFHLLSNTEAPILDAEVLWAAKVKSMVPR
ncbi:XRE family transcriptional regulator [Mesorhizobium sp. M0514]|uniref:XRE family transcriptional regulator n=1 Tax=Mesorhizobium sp. M0514 TaxID=2956955 RepID=UPI003337257F